MLKKLVERHVKTALDDLLKRQAVLDAEITRIALEWEDVKHQVRRSYQRLEKANERAEAREGNGEAKSPCEDPQNPSSGLGAGGFLSTYMNAMRSE